MKDKNGQEIVCGDEVDVEEPNSTDIHSHSFRGTVIEMNESECYVTVRDQDDSYFDVDCDKVEVM